LCSGTGITIMFFLFFNQLTFFSKYLIIRADTSRDNSLTNRYFIVFIVFSINLFSYDVAMSRRSR
ncbi:MAG: hypothetical protein AAB784_02925, partial [Patescibacteria group bacterium]